MDGKEPCDSDTVRRVVDESMALAGARPCDNVTIVGVRHVDILIEFARRGFKHVECRSAPGGAQSADLVVAYIDKVGDLLAILSRIRRSLRKGGSILVETTKSMSNDLASLAALLMSQGFVTENALASAAGGCVVCARKSLA
jgi:hypothetical protein